MKLLVGGCSFSAGFGLPNGINNPNNWPNLLANKLNATVTNVSRTGYDNQGIFLNTLAECTATDYDLILIQVTQLSRIVLSPDLHGTILLTPDLDFDFWSKWISKKEYKTFYKTFVKLNGDFEHWVRLTKVIFICQNLIDKGYNIKFVNGLLHWDQEFFTNQQSNFADELIDINMLPECDISKGLDIVNNIKSKINLEHWINPFDSLKDLQVDFISDINPHPGPQSQKIFADMIFNRLTQNQTTIEK